ncbi:Uncharacterized protein QTN25_007259 [Entamoeba marina]
MIPKQFVDNQLVVDAFNLIYSHKNIDLVNKINKQLLSPLLDVYFTLNDNSYIEKESILKALLVICNSHKPSQRHKYEPPKSYPFYMALNNYLNKFCEQLKIKPTSLITHWIEVALSCLTQREYITSTIYIQTIMKLFEHLIIYSMDYRLKSLFYNESLLNFFDECLQSKYGSGMKVHCSELIWNIINQDLHLNVFPLSFFPVLNTYFTQINDIHVENSLRIEYDEYNKNLNSMARHGVIDKKTVEIKSDMESDILQVQHTKLRF